MIDDGDIKLRTARTLKWNSIDRFSSQILYAVTGVILANLLPKEDFGLIGAILVFQAFATIFVDSGFGSALLQKKEPTQRDYSTVFWFNLIMSGALYSLLYVCAPLIATLFQNDVRLIPLSRVMFLAFVINGLGIVQTNLLMKRMTVKMLAVSNIAGLTLSGAAGIALALAGYGAWALVWQTIILAGVRITWLWLAASWRPSACFSIESLRSIYRVGAGVFTSSLLNTIFLNIYSFVIGVWYSLTALGDYTQADKWSKMGSASLSQILTATFVPLLSRYQDDSHRYLQTMYSLNRLTAFMVFPFMGALAVMAPAIFHTLFANKWDSAIVLFQILVGRGLLTVLCSVYSNYLLSLGYARTLVLVEVVKDVATLLAILATVWQGSVECLVWGQLGAGVVTYVLVLRLTSRATGFSVGSLTRGMGFYLMLTVAAMTGSWLLSALITDAPCLLTAQIAVGALIYFGTLALMRDPVLKEAKAYICKKKH